MIVPGTAPVCRAAGGELPLRWQRAAVIAGIWAAVEIVLGSFLHNLRIPFAGSMLAVIGVVIMAGFQRIWPYRGIIWRAGILCALMKSVSPSALIFGPMVGILSEALLMEAGLWMLGRNVAGYMLGGMLAVSSALVHKAVSILILYGWNFVTIYKNLFDFLVKQLRVEGFSFLEMLAAVLVVYFLFGLLAALAGYVAGGKASRIPPERLNLPDGGRPADAVSWFAPDPAVKKYAPAWLSFHLLFLPAMLFLIPLVRPAGAAVLVAAYLIISRLRYRTVFCRLKNPTLWVQLALVTLFSLIFWNEPVDSLHDFRWNGLWIGLEVCLRAVLVIVGFASLSAELRHPLVRGFLEGKGLTPLYRAISLSFSSLPVIMEFIPAPRLWIRDPFRFFSIVLTTGNQWLETIAGEKGRGGD